MRKDILNAFWLMSGSLTRAGTGILLAAVLSYKLNIELFGEYQYYLAILSIYLAFDYIIAPNLIKRYFVEHEGKEDLMFGSFAVLIVTLTVLIVSIIFGISRVTNLFSLSPELFIILSILIFRFSNPIVYWLDNKLKSKQTVVIQLITYLTSFFGVLYVSLTTQKLTHLILAYALQYVLAPLLLILVYIKINGRIAFKFDLNFTKKLFKESLSLFIANLAFILLLRIDQVILGWLADKSEVAIYATAVRLSEPWAFLCGAITASVFPSLSESYKLNKPLFIERLRRLFSLLLVIGLFLSMAVTLFAPFVLPLIFSKSMTELPIVVAIHIWSNIFYFWYFALEIWDVHERKTKLTMWRTFFALAVSILMNLLLIPQYGARGAAASTVIAYAILGFGSYVLNKSAREPMLLQLQALAFWRFVKANQLAQVVFTRKKGE